MNERHWEYKLVGHIPVPATHEEALEAWRADRHVALTMVGPYRVSTVFLVLDHGYGDMPPLLFETMVFGSGVHEWLDEYMDRYTTWEQAEQGHERICALVRMKVAKGEREPTSG